MNHNFVLFFDGECNLCNNAVQFVIDRDKKSKIKFAPLQSQIAKNTLPPQKNDETYIDSLVFIEKSKIYFKSSAALHVAKNLDGLWPIVFAFILLPKSIRDFIYDYIAKNRMKWFGRSVYCRVMTDDLRDRFL